MRAGDKAETLERLEANQPRSADGGLQTSRAADVPLHHETKTLKTARRIQVPVLEEDEAIIKAKARALRLSVATYLRQLGLGFEPPSTLDSHAVRDLAKVNGDQGRLGGLLKLWLTDDAKFREFAHPQDVRSAVLALLQELGASQKQLQALMQRLVDGSAHR
jgi:hypothetical protein